MSECEQCFSLLPLIFLYFSAAAGSDIRVAVEPGSSSSIWEAAANNDVLALQRYLRESDNTLLDAVDVEGW